LTNQETLDLHVSPVSVTGGNQKSRLKEWDQFKSEFNSMKEGESKSIKLTVADKANIKGTLGTFTVIYEGVLKRGTGLNWEFNGTMQFTDFWNFDKKKDGERTKSGESATAIGRALLTGKGFPIRSPVYNVTEKSDDGVTNWFIGKDDSKGGLSTAGEIVTGAKERLDNTIDKIKNCLD
jgi:hypothetical protein